MEALPIGKSTMKDMKGMKGFLVFLHVLHVLHGVNPIVIFYSQRMLHLKSLSGWEDA